MRHGEASQPFRPGGEAFARVSRIQARLVDGKGPAPRVLVIGAGRSGMAAIALLVKSGADITVADDDEAGRARVLERYPRMKVAPLDVAMVEAAELVVLSPGVPRAREELEAAVEAGKVVGEVELASWFVRVPMVGITGTNGKSTTTALVAHMLEQVHPGRVFAGGNLGRPLSELAIDPDGVDAAVVELSSYQLESVVQAKFRVACWLNLTPDHTDRYASIESYAGAKRRIIEQRAVNGAAVLNAKDPWCSEAGLAIGGPVRWFAASATSQLAGHTGTRLLRATAAERAEAGRFERYELDNPALIGLHNKANALAAIECARLMGASEDAVQAGLSTFGGLEHRLEAVAEIDGVEWRNDSKATNVDSAVTALYALDRPIQLIAGGLDKGASWAPLVEVAKGRVKRVFAIGRAAPIVEAAFAGSGIEVETSGTLEVAVEAAAAAAEAGDAVLLSPACASFDQFDSFVARGERFKALVKAREGEG